MTSPSPSLSKNSTSSESFRSVAIPSLYLVGHRSISHFLPHKIEVDTGVLLRLNGSSRALDQLRDVIQQMSASSLSPLPLPFPAIRCPATLEKYLAREALPRGRKRRHGHYMSDEIWRSAQDRCIIVPPVCRNARTSIGASQESVFACSKLKDAPLLRAHHRVINLHGLFEKRWRMLYFAELLRKN